VRRIVISGLVAVAAVVGGVAVPAAAMHSRRRRPGRHRGPGGSRGRRRIPSSGGPAGAALWADSWPRFGGENGPAGVHCAIRTVASL